MMSDNQRYDISYIFLFNQFLQNALIYKFSCSKTICDTGK